MQKTAELKKMDSNAFSKRSDTAVYWLGGGGAMINSRGTIIMIDPVFEGFDMKLLIDPPIHSDEVPHVDAVIITHCDNDHFGRETLKNLKDKVDVYHSTKYVASLFESIGIHAEGHAIHDSFKINDVTVSLTPADHAWQNDSVKHSLERHFEMEDFCGFRIETQDGSIWMPGDSRLMEEQLHQSPMDMILLDISDSKWHIGLDGVNKLTAAYPNAVLVPIHWGCVDAPEWKEFNGDPFAVKKMIVNPERMHISAVGDEVIL